MLNSVAKKKQVMDVNLEAEMMLFPGSNRYVMASRNWLAVELDVGTPNPGGSKLWANWRVETKTNGKAARRGRVVGEVGWPDGGWR